MNSGREISAQRSSKTKKAFLVLSLLVVTLLLPGIHLAQADVWGTEGGLPNAALTPANSWDLDNGSGTPTVNFVFPRFSGVANSVHTTDLHGAGFQAGAQVKLSRSGHPDIEATNENVVSANQITCDLDLSAAAWGAWDVGVANPDVKSAALHGAFFVGTATGQAWGLER